MGWCRPPWRGLQKDSFVDDLWKLFDFDSDGAITQEEYRRGCLAHPELISQLGLGRTWTLLLYAATAPAAPN